MYVSHPAISCFGPSYSGTAWNTNISVCNPPRPFNARVVAAPRGAGCRSALENWTLLGKPLLAATLFLDSTTATEGRAGRTPPLGRDAQRLLPAASTLIIPGVQSVFQFDINRDRRSRGQPLPLGWHRNSAELVAVPPSGRPGNILCPSPTGILRDLSLCLAEASGGLQHSPCSIASPLASARKQLRNILRTSPAGISSRFCSRKTSEIPLLGGRATEQLGTRKPGFARQHARTALGPRGRGCPRRAGDAAHRYIVRRQKTAKDATRPILRFA